MVVVAIAGAGSVGNQIILHLLKTSHTVIVLSRSPQPSLTSLGADVRVVDYTLLPSLVTALKGVHTVICTLFAPSPSVTLTSQLNLLSAAISCGVTRFAPSEFSYTAAGNHTMDWYHCKLEVMEKVKESGLEYTAFRNGQLMNYWAHGSPHLKAVEEGLAGMGFAFVVDVGNETAEIPGTGDEKVTFTRTQDVGAFVAAAVGLEKWEEEMGMGGETTTYNKVVRKVKEMGRKMEVTYRSREWLEGEIEKEGSREDGGRKFYLQAMLAIAKGEGEIKMRLNELVSEIKPWGVDKFLGIWWGNEGSGEK